MIIFHQQYWFWYGKIGKHPLSLESLGIYTKDYPQSFGSSTDKQYYGKVNEKSMCNGNTYDQVCEIKWMEIMHKNIKL